jgi:holo-[acyl-carrier protein] synthase
VILGLGNDIVEIERIRGIMQRYPQRFLDRVFTLSEQAYCQERKDPAVHFAGRFAAKEALVKALGTGFSQGIGWKDFEILPDHRGKPSVHLSRQTQERLGNLSLMISISHCRHYATAVALWLANHMTPRA